MTHLTLNWPGGVMMTVLLTVVSLGLLAWTKDHRDTRWFQARLFLAAIGVRLAFAVLIYSGGLLTVLKDEDSLGWFSAVKLVNRWHAEGLGDWSVMSVAHDVFSTANQGYRFLLAAVFWATGMMGRLPAAAVSACAGAIGAVFVYRITRRVAAESAARRAAWFVAWMPLMVIWTSQTFKEPLVLLFEALGLYACVRLYEGSVSARHVSIAVLSFVLVTSMRFYIGLVLGAAMLVSVIIAGWRGRSAGIGAAVVRLGLAAMVIVSSLWIVDAVRYKQLDLEYVQQFREGVSPGGTALSAGPDPFNPTSPVAPSGQAASARPGSSASTPRAAAASSANSAGTGAKATLDLRKPLEAPVVLGLGAMYALLAPFPWQFAGQSLRFQLTAPDVALWWILFFVVVVPGVWRAVRYRLRDVLPLLTFLVLLTGLYSAMFGNVGIAYRQRAQLFPVLLIIAAAGNYPRGGAVRRTARGVGLTLTACLPGPLKRMVYRHAFGYQIARGARIGLAFLDCARLEIAAGARIGHGVAFVRCGAVRIGEHALIGSLNLFRGGGRIDIGAYASVLRLNVINAIPDHDCTTAPDQTFVLGYGAVVTAEHRIDFTDRVEIGRGSIVAGRNSSLWTHNRRDSAPIVIGEYCYIGSESRLAPGVAVADCCIVGLGSVMTRAFTESYSLIAGVPAIRRRSLGPPDHATIFGKTRRDLPDDWCRPPAPPASV